MLSGTRATWKWLDSLVFHLPLPLASDLTPSSLPRWGRHDDGINGSRNILQIDEAASTHLSSGIETSGTLFMSVKSGRRQKQSLFLVGVILKFCRIFKGNLNYAPRTKKGEKFIYDAFIFFQVRKTRFRKFLQK